MLPACRQSFKIELHLLYLLNKNHNGNHNNEHWNILVFVPLENKFENVAIDNFRPCLKSFNVFWNNGSIKLYGKIILDLILLVYILHEIKARKLNNSIKQLMSRRNQCVYKDPSYNQIVKSSRKK